MRKKGQFAIVGVFISVAIAIFFWAVGLSGIINNYTQNMIVTQGITGITAFAWAYMNLWIMLLFFLVVSAGSYIARSE
jgi:hypothetical protein